MDVEKLMVVALAGWTNQQQDDVIDYLREGEGEVNCHERLGGLLRYYHRDAA